MISKVLDFLKGHYKTILMSLGGLFLLYWVVFVLTPKVGMDSSEKAKIDSLNNTIKEIYKEQQNYTLISHITAHSKSTPHNPCKLTQPT